MRETADLRIDRIRPLIPPAVLIEELPLTEAAAASIYLARRAVTDVLRGTDDRLLVVVGPCSIHDTAAARDYAARLHDVAMRLGRDLLLVMRVYFEKPRTTVGWKGLINDPRLDGTFAINEGLHLARGLLRDLAIMGMPAGSEFLDTITPQYLADLVSWGAIGARTTESQVHRELASGLSMPVGFKNGTDGNARVAIEAVHTARRAHHFLSVTKEGLSAIVASRGNDCCHVILRGGSQGPNYDTANVSEVTRALGEAGLPQRIVIDCSHGNSCKDPERQPLIASQIGERIAAGERVVVGLMLESHLVGGRQDCAPGRAMTYGQSITDSCLSWNATVPVLDDLAAAVRRRREPGARVGHAAVNRGYSLATDEARTEGVPR